MNATQEAPDRSHAPGYAPPAYPQAPPLAAAQPVRLRDPRAKSPALAAVLSLMPGLGQIYVGYYQRGFVHAMVVAGIITILANEMIVTLNPLLGLFLAFFWLYNIIDAARRASLYNQALEGGAPVELPGDLRMPRGRGSVAGGVSLIVAGAILLLNTRFGMSLDWVKDWWPVAPMIFGAYLVARAIQERRSSHPPDEGGNG